MKQDGKAGQALSPMYYVYVLQNALGRYYIGSCENIETRLKRHNQNSVRSTKNKGPYKLVLKEEFSDKTAARRRENELKSCKGNIKFQKVIKGSTLSSSLV